MFENDYTINGKHATYLKFLAKKNARDDQSPDNPTAARLFERYIDVYMNAAVFGLLYNRTAKRDNSSTTAPEYMPMLLPMSGKTAFFSTAWLCSLTRQ